MIASLEHKRRAPISTCVSTRAGLAIAMQEPIVLREITAMVRRPLAGTKHKNVAWERALGIDLDGVARFVAQTLLGG